MMNQNKIEIKSKNLPFLKLGILGIVTISFVILAILNKDTDSLIFPAIFTFMSLIEILLFKRTIIVFDNNKLNYLETNFLKSITNKGELKVTDIQNFNFTQKKYDSWGMINRMFWELLFPSGQSWLTINLKSGESIKIHFKGSEQDVSLLTSKLQNQNPV